MAGRKGGRVVAGPVFPRSIYGASKHRWPGTPECAPDLSHSISRGIGNVLTIAADPKHLGASIGFLAVLHTWGQNLHLHPHLHCVIPGGGISPDGASWVGCRKSFFLPVRVLSRLFRSKFLIYLRKAFREGKLRCHGEMAFGQVGSIRGPVPRSGTDRVGCLCEAAMRRPRASSEVSGALHASGCHRQSTAVVDGRRAGDF